MSAQDSLTLLHVSDPQFGRNHRFGNLSLPEPDAKFDTLFQRLSDDLSILEKAEVHPQLIVVSGDLAEQAKKSEFEDVLQFLISLSDRLKVPRRRVVIVPGNHDINRNLCEAYFKQCDGEEQPPIPPYWPKWKHYHWLFQEFYKDEKGISFTIEEPWTFWELDELKLVVAGLNSTMAESHLNNTHFGYIGEAQIRWFFDRLASFRERGWFRLGVVHHNIQRGATDDDENLRDADDLKRTLGPSLNMLLHGHTHNSKVGWANTALPVLSTGSAALKAEARPVEVPNQYQAIRIWPDRIERWTRRYDPEQKRWIADPRCSDNGNHWHIEHPVAFESVQAIFPGAAPLPPPHARPDGERPDPRDDFLSRVSAVCRLRYRNSEVDVHSGYLRVTAADGPIARVFPVAVCEYGMSEDDLERLRREVFAQYRALEPNLPCEIVYGGPHASDDLIRKAAASGVRLSSFVEFQGIIDFSNYVDRQTRKLESDIIYPPKLYVPQRQVYEIGRDRHEAQDACVAILDWLTEPLARFVLVLGDFGAGKSFLLHEVARRMPEQIPHMTPVFIELRQLEKARTLDQLVAQHLAAAGERYIDLAAFPYMLREGRVALLFDGFDELAQRVTYERATEHFETLLKSAAGRAKVVVTSRTQHFESDKQVKTALLERTEALPGLHLVRLQPFDEPQIVEFLEKLLGGHAAAARRFELIKDIRDLLGLSHNPRMLSFIAGLPEEQLREAQAKSGKITSAELYRLLIDRWLTYEYEQTQPKASAPTLNVKERWDAVTAVALYIWPKLEPTVRLSELTAEVAHILYKLTERQLDPRIATHVVGSGTLLVRDEAGTFAFVHQSVMEWLVANYAAEQIISRRQSDVLSEREMSSLMADFLCELVGAELARGWAEYTLHAPDLPKITKENAQLVLARVGETEQRDNDSGWEPRFPWIEWLNGSGSEDAINSVTISAMALSTIKVRTVRLRNIRVFQDTGRLPLTNASLSSSSSVTVIVGDNAAGKTTLLQSIAFAFLGPELANQVEPRPQRFLRHSEQRGIIEVEFSLENPASEPNIVDSFLVGVEIRAGENNFRSAANSDLTLGGQNNSAPFNAAERLNVIRRLTQDQFGFLCGYGSWRTVSIEPDALLPEEAKPMLDRIVSLFRARHVLMDPDILGKLLVGDLSNIRNLRPRRLEESHRQAILDTVCALLPGITEVHSGKSSEIVLWGNPVPLRELSEGYGSILSLVGHLLRHGFESKGSSFSPKDLNGVVLVDEADLHLHPAWQRHVIPDLQRAFPNIQFILTTHSAMVAGSVPTDRLFVLRQREHDIEVLSDLPTVQGFRADQILTSLLFDLDSTRDTETAQLLAQYTELSTSNTLSPELQAKLKAISEKLRLRLPSEEERQEARDASALIEETYRSRFDAMPPSKKEGLLKEVRAQLHALLTGVRRPQ
jgi:tRNA A37 threonylcarbamoyladenosine biosynthesis protein TsaE